MLLLLLGGVGLIVAFLAAYLEWGVTLVAVVFAAFIVTFCLVYYLGIFRQLGKVITQVEALLTGGKYKKVFLPKQNEFGVLAQFFNTMTDNVESVSDDLKEGDRMSSELGLAAEIQKSILPKSIPALAKLDVTAKTRPASEVGGDSFGFMKKTETQTFFYLGDVTGHGAPAGLIMMMVNTLLDVFLPQVETTDRWVTKVNKALTPRVNRTMFMTSIMLRWDSEAEKLYYSGAGHEHILIYRASEGVCEALATGGIALGMTDDVSAIVKEKELPLSKEDMVILYTDGIPEARNASGEMYTLDRLKTAINTHAHLGNSQKLFEKLAQDLAEFVGDEEQLDDITLLILRYVGAGAPVSDEPSLLTTGWQ
jgi:sigma-B regulation protein RsbU (phosphoserine phosphatase)